VRAEPKPSLSSFQQFSLVALRTLIGWHFLYEGIYKLRLPGWSPDGHPIPAWTARGFITGATGPIGGLARAAADAGLLPWIDRLMMLGVAAVGLSLILGLLTRAGCVGGLLLLGLFYVMQVPTTGMPQPMAEGSYLLVNKTLVEGMAVLVLFSFDTGRIAGLDRLWRERRRAPSPVLAAEGRAVQQPQGSGT
jgi:thiosulfate dehydrogenase [quinone] large subunit